MIRGAGRLPKCCVVEGGLRVALGLLLAVGALGCGSNPKSVVLSRWELTTSDGRTTALSLPDRLPLPDVLREGESFELRRTVRLPERLTHGVQTLHIPSYPSIVTLSADGRAIPVRGVPWRVTYARQQPHAFDLPESVVRDGRVELRLTVTHRWPLDRDFATVPRILPKGEVDPQSLRLALLHVVVALLVLGGIAVVAIGATVVAATRRSRRDYAFLAMAAVFVAPFVASEAGIGQALGFGLGELIVAAMGFPVTVTAMLWFTSHFYDLPRPSHGWTVIAFVPAIVYAANPDPFESSNRVALAVTVVVALGVGRLFPQIASLRREGREGATILLACLSFVTLFAAPDLAFHMGLPDVTGGARTGILAILAFVWAVAFLVVRGDEAAVAAVTDELAATVRILEQRREENRAANEELRRAVIARSARLYSGLAAAARPAAPPPLDNGSELDGSYVIGDVRRGRRPFRSYKATRTASGDPCWVTPLAGASGASFAGMIEDLRSLIRLRDPRIGRIARVDIAPEGFVYVDADQIEGVTLDEFSRSRPSMEDRFSVLAEGARGLETLHAHSLCHRVVSEQTLFVHRDNGDLRVTWADVALSPRFRTTKRPAREGEVDSTSVAMGTATATVASEAEADPTEVGSPESYGDDATPTSTPDPGAEPSSEDLGSHESNESNESFDSFATNQSFDSFDTEGTNATSAESPAERTVVGAPRAIDVIAPELETKSNRFTPAADIFAFARLATTLLADVFATDESEPRASANVGAALDLLRAALDSKPTNRPDAAALALALELASEGDVRALRDAAGDA